MPHTKDVSHMIQNESTQWDVSDGLVGKVADNFEELKEMFAEKGITILNHPKRENEYRKGLIYTKPCAFNGHAQIAYECKSKCKKIIVGAPVIEIFPVSPTDDKVERVIHKCNHCDEIIYDRTYKH